MFTPTDEGGTVSFRYYIIQIDKRIKNPLQTRLADCSDYTVSLTLTNVSASPERWYEVN